MQVQAKTLLNRNLCRLSLLLGSLGLIGCVAALVITWSVKSRVTEASERVYEIGCDSIQSVQHQVVQTQELLRTLPEATQRAVEAKLQRTVSTATDDWVASRVAQAEEWLQVAESLLKIVARTIEVGRSLELPVQVSDIELLLDDVDLLRAELTQVKTAFDRVLESALKLEVTEESSSEVELGHETLRPMQAEFEAKLRACSSKLDILVRKLDELTLQLAQLRDRTQATVWWVTVGITFFILWLAAGQLALARWGWSGLRSPAKANQN